MVNMNEPRCSKKLENYFIQWQPKQPEFFFQNFFFDKT